MIKIYPEGSEWQVELKKLNFLSKKEVDQIVESINKSEDDNTDISAFTYTL